MMTFGYEFHNSMVQDHQDHQDYQNYEVSKVRSPWRRFFARSFDFYIYAVILFGVQSLILNINTAEHTSIENLLISFFVYLLMILVEPLLLSLFGTTPGKWLLGLHVTGLSGQKMTYVEGLNRTATVFWRGLGLNIPIIGLISQWMSYKDCAAGKTLDWEYETIIHLKDQKKWRIGSYFAGILVLIAIVVLIFNLALMPKNRGDLTVEAFSENYNKLAAYLEVDNYKILNKEGQWVTLETDEQVINISFEPEPPVFQYIVEDNYMTGMQFGVELRNSDAWITGFQKEIVLAILSFVRAQPGNTVNSKDVNAIIKQISESPLEDYQFNSHGVTIISDFEHYGYRSSTNDGLLFPIGEDSETYFSIDFKMFK